MEAFKKYFFPLLLEYDNTDFSTPDPEPLRYSTKGALPLVDEEEVYSILASKKLYTAPRIDGYPYAFLKALRGLFIKAFTPLITVY